MSAMITDQAIDAVNTGAARLRGYWLGFLAITLYILVTVSGLTHEDLLTYKRLTVPIVALDVPFAGFFVFSPTVYLIMHLWILVHHRVFSEKIDYLERTLSSDPDSSQEKR